VVDIVSGDKDALGKRKPHPKVPEVKEVKEDSMYGESVKVKVYTPGRLPDDTKKKKELDRLKVLNHLRNIMKKDEANGSRKDNTQDA